MNQFDKESNKSHNEESYPRGTGNRSEFLAVGFGTTLDEMRRVFGKLTERFNENFVKALFVVVGGCHVCTIVCGVESVRGVWRSTRDGLWIRKGGHCE